MNDKQVQNREQLKDNQNPKSITPRSEDYSRWYHDVIAFAELAENAPIKGCMTIKPNGYAIWENIQSQLDTQIKALGVRNAYFPLFIPESFIKRESEHIEGFSPELAIVTHGGGKKLEEPLIVRPTSETIIYEAFSRWVQSYRDLPLLINQWANIVRWEMRPRLFIRTTEFLWQEGHTVHKTPGEANEYALMILRDVYKKFVEEYLAIPVYSGKKSEHEKFAGALSTYCIEALMQDGKSLQMGTSHYLSDNFAKPFGITFLDDKGNVKYAFQTSWGMSTRLIGGIIMSHSDDKGLVLPPKIAPIQCMIVPVNSGEDKEVIIASKNILTMLSGNARTNLDDRPQLRAGEKYYEWEKKGVPVRIEIGPKDISSGKCVLVRRDTGVKESCLLSDVVVKTQSLLDSIQDNLFKTALERREQQSFTVNKWGEFKTKIDKGYVFAHWCEDGECERIIKEETKATTRCHPFDFSTEDCQHTCIRCDKKSPSNKRWIFGKAY